MEWLLCNCGLPAGLEGAAQDAPAELDEPELRRRERKGRRSDDADRRERRSRRDGDKRDDRAPRQRKRGAEKGAPDLATAPALGASSAGAKTGTVSARVNALKAAPAAVPTMFARPPGSRNEPGSAPRVQFEDESPVGVEEFEDRRPASTGGALGDDDAGFNEALLAAKVRAGAASATWGRDAAPPVAKLSPRLVETPQSQPIMKASLSDTLRRKKYVARQALGARDDERFRPIVPPPRSGEAPRWQAAAVAAPLLIDGEREFRELLSGMCLDDLLQLDAYRNTVLAYFASRDCPRGCNLVLRHANEVARVALAARPNLYGLSALDYARKHRSRGSCVLSVFKHYGVDKAVFAPAGER